MAFSIAEQNYLLGVLDSERFADTAPAAIYATLLDEGGRLPNVRFDPDKPPPVIRGHNLRMPRHLYVRYGA